MLNNQINVETMADDGFDDVDYPEEVAIQSRIERQLVHSNDILDGFEGDDVLFSQTNTVILSDQSNTINELLMEDEDLYGAYSLTAD